MKILVTGFDGFVGKHLLDEIKLYKHDQAVCLTHPKNVFVDLRDIKNLEEAINSHPFDSVIHLAGQSFVPRSFENPQETYDINFWGLFNLFSILKKNNFKGKFLYVGSSDCYGIVDDKLLPIKEELPLKPRSPYAVSKIAAEALCFQWSQTESFEVIMTRPFNHIGPGQNERFVVPSFAKQIIEIRHQKRKPVIKVGNINVTRDFTDVRDIVKAYYLLVKKGKNGEVYNVCSEKELSIRFLLEKMIQLSGVEVEIKEDPTLIRKNEHQRVCGSFGKLNKEVGWKPEYSLETTLNDIFLGLESKYHD